VKKHAVNARFAAAKALLGGHLRHPARAKAVDAGDATALHEVERRRPFQQLLQVRVLARSATS